MKTINNNIKEKRVGFPNAKLLKEKGFDVLGKYCYDCLGDIYSVKLENHNKHTKKFTAPTQQVAIDWILKNHTIWIQIVKTDALASLCNYVILWHNGVCHNEARGGGFNTPEEAKEEGIKYILTKLI